LQIPSKKRKMTVWQRNSHILCCSMGIRSNNCASSFDACGNKNAENKSRATALKIPDSGGLLG
jgi:hypothetical protein